MNGDGAVVARGARVGLVMNPASAAGRARFRGQQASARLRAAGLDVRVLPSGSAAATRAEVRRALDSGVLDALVLVGGDGLLHTVINERPTIPVGIVPSGSGNDFARAVGIPLHSVAAAVDRIVGAWQSPRVVDLLEVGHSGSTSLVAGALSVGFDALVNRIANGIQGRLGAFKYQIALIVALFRFHPVDFRVSGPDVEMAGRKLLMTAALIPTIGGGIPLIPGAGTTPGTFRLFVVDEMSGWRILTLLPTLARRAHFALPEVTVVDTAEARVDVAPGERAQFGYGDGEHLGLTPFRVRVAPGALRVLA